MAGLHIPSAYVPDADMTTCVLIDRYALIQSPGKLHGCQTFGDLAGVFLQIATHYSGERLARVDVVFACYMGLDSIAIKREWANRSQLTCLLKNYTPHSHRY